MSLNAGECQVWWADLAAAAPWQRSLLDSVERARRDRYLHAPDRDRFTIGVALTRILLAAELGVPPHRLRIDRTCPHCRQPHGKPRVSYPANADIHYSISHSGDRVVLAMARTPVGIDVERSTDLRDLESLIDSVLSPTEMVELARLGAHRRTPCFFRYWTRKEAVVKATGHGLTMPMSELTVSAPDQAASLLEWSGGASASASADGPDVAAMALHDLSPGEGYFASLALVDGRRVTVTEQDASDVLAAPGDADQLI